MVIKMKNDRFNVRFFLFNSFWMANLSLAYRLEPKPA